MRHRGCHAVCSLPEEDADNFSFQPAAGEGRLKEKVVFREKGMGGESFFNAWKRRAQNVPSSGRCLRRSFLLDERFQYGERVALLRPWQITELFKQLPRLAARSALRRWPFTEKI